MSPHSHLIQTLADNLKEQMIFIEKAIKNLPEEKLWHQANQNSNSIGILCQHLCGNMGQYVISGIGKVNDTRDRGEEFVSKHGESKNTVLHELQLTFNKVLKIIIGLNEVEMQNKHHIQGIKINTLEVLLHVSHHFAYHAGQIVYLTKLLTNKQLDLFEGRDLNLKNA